MRFFVKNYIGYWGRALGIIDYMGSYVPNTAQNELLINAGLNMSWADGLHWADPPWISSVVISYHVVLYSTVQYCTVLYSTVQYCTVQYCTVLYITVQYCTVLYSAVQCCTVLYSSVLYSTVQCCTVLYSTVQYINSHKTQDFSKYRFFEAWPYGNI